MIRLELFLIHRDMTFVVDWRLNVELLPGILLSDLAENTLSKLHVAEKMPPWRLGMVCGVCFGVASIVMPDIAGAEWGRARRL